MQLSFLQLKVGCSFLLPILVGRGRTSEAVLGLLITLPSNPIRFGSLGSCEVGGSRKGGSRECINGLVAYVKRTLCFPLFLHAAEMSRGKSRVFWQSPTSKQKEKVLFRVTWVMAPNSIFAGFSYGWH